MSTHFTCDDTDTLVAYLYDELDAAAHAAVARHLATCPRCADEVAALGGVRRVLGEWTPPAPPLRFTVSADTPVGDTVLTPAVSRWQRVPVWAQFAAATLALAVGTAVANLQVRHDDRGWTLTTGWITPAAPAPAAVPADWQPALAALEASLRSEMAREVKAAPAPQPAAAPGVDEQTIARVRSLIQESERRQQQQLALRLTQFGRDLDLQRRADLVRIGQGIGQLEGRTGAEVARQREMLNYLVRAGLRPPQ